MVSSLKFKACQLKKAITGWFLSAPTSAAAAAAAAAINLPEMGIFALSQKPATF